MSEQPTQDQCRIAAHLNLHPGMPDDWPMEIINRLVRLEKECGREALLYALQRLTQNWGTVIEACRSKLRGKELQE